MSFAERLDMSVCGVALRVSGQSLSGWIGLQGIILRNGAEGVVTLKIIVISVIYLAMMKLSEKILMLGFIKLERNG